MTETTTYTLIDGRKVSSEIKLEIAAKVAERKKLNKKIPHLAIILVGDDGASHTAGEFFVAVHVQHSAEIALGVGVAHVGSGHALRGVHAHIERSVVAVRKATLSQIELR